MEKLGTSDPRTIGAYRLLGRLGAGGLGQVFLARSAGGRTVAVKLVRAELAEQEEFRRRFRQEVRTARQVGGPWTAPVLDADTEAALPWLAAGYVAGPSLHTVVAREHGPLPERSVRILAAGLAYALRDIHSAGIVHRDLKPSNVLLTIDGPRVIDFGIARALETVTEGGLTRTGALVGSPGFMAPEQVRGDPITPACDVFCLGSVLAYAATGTLPFGAESSGAHALMFRIAQEEPDLGALPKPLRELVHDCLAKEPRDRPSVEELLRRTGAQDTVVDGRARETWLPGALIEQLARHAVRLLDAEEPGAVATGLPEVRVPEPRSARSLRSLVDGRAGAGSSGMDAGPGSVRGSVPGSVPGSGFGSVPGSGLGSVPGSVPGQRSGDGSSDAARRWGDGSSDAARRWGDGSSDAARRSGDGSSDAGDAGRPATPEPTPAGDADPPPNDPPSNAPPLDGTPLNSPPLEDLPTLAATPDADPHAQATSDYPQPVGYGHPATGGASAALPGSEGPFGLPPGPPAPPGPPFGSDAWYAQAEELDQQPPPHQRNGRFTALLLAVAVTVAVGAGGSVYALMKGEGPARPENRETPAPTVPAPTVAPTRGSTSADPTARGGVPEAYLGTWRAAFEAGGGRNTRILTLTQGARGEQVMRLEGTGPHYTCSWTARFRSADGTLTLGPSTVTRGDPESCRPGPVSELTLPDDHTLVRDLTGSGGTPLTYTRTG